MGGLVMTIKTDIISLKLAKHLPGLLAERVSRSPDSIAYTQFNEQNQQWETITWQQVANIVEHRKAALAAEHFQPGDRIAIMLRNCCEWVYFDMAALSLGLVTVPLYPNDRADNVAYILEHSGARLLLVEDLSKQADLAQHPALTALDRVLSLIHSPTVDTLAECRSLDTWLGEDNDKHVITTPLIKPDDLASIVYTSGTTGPPKGVMLSHHNMLWNAWSGLQSIAIFPTDKFLSFLPLSHTLERSIGYYLPMMAGASTSYARSVPQLGEDLLTQQPTVLISVPRIYERVYQKLQDKLREKPALAQSLFKSAVEVGWRHFEYQQRRIAWHPALLFYPLLNLLVGKTLRDRLGGQLRVAICGGAPLPEHIAKTFIALGIPLIQGYGLTETSPVVSVNTLENNLPRSIGHHLQDVTVRFSDDGELQVKSPGVMLGYWQNDAATTKTIDPSGWLSTGDLGHQDTEGFIHITGRLKDIIVMANGEKVSPSDMELAIAKDPFIDSVLVIGEGRPFLSTLLVLNDNAWLELAQQHHIATANPEQLQSNPSVNSFLLGRIQQQLHHFPGYAHIRRLLISLDPWTVENDLSTPTLKAKRSHILKRYAGEIDQLYEGHQS
jgi:long-chain acyl-CoA synthetase